ncbi:MAG: 6-phosphofructokinase [Candidatus Peregrinibacteria bacterium Greene0416_19]|nr:MAG: 6-phosphofructokinase [Candidatus Peregrinibacteria bacterium Greene0416_19]
MANRSDTQRIGIFTGGGIAPGINRVIFGAAAELKKKGHDVIGIPDGWAGMLEVRRDIMQLSTLNRWELSKLFRGGGTKLGSSRTKIDESQYETVRAASREYGLDGVIAVGGDDTLGQAARLYEKKILNIIGVPKTIDNDVGGTDMTFGFHSAVEEAAKFIDRMSTDAESMRRVAAVELMGRDAGHVTIQAAYAGGAHITLIPEYPIDVSRLLPRIQEIYAARRHVIIAIAEGYEHLQPPVLDHQEEVDAFGNVRKEGAAKSLLRIIREKTGLPTQEQIAGYHVRNGPPLAHDGNFAAELGAAAGWLAHERMYGRMVALRDGSITAIPLSDVRGGRLVQEDEYDQETMMKRDLPPAFVRDMQILTNSAPGA